MGSFPNSVPTRLLNSWRLRSNRLTPVIFVAQFRRRGAMNMPHRYQYGSLTRRKRIRTEDVWQFRYYETSPEGQRRRRSKIVGMLSQYPTPTDALRILERFRLRLNLQNRLGLPVTLDALADDYVEKELPLLRYGTQQAHLSSLHRWIRPRWGWMLRLRNQADRG